MRNNLYKMLINLTANGSDINSTLYKTHFLIVKPSNPVPFADVCNIHTTVFHQSANRPCANIHTTVFHQSANRPCANIHYREDNKALELKKKNLYEKTINGFK